MSLQEVEEKTQENINQIKANYEQQKRALETKLHDDKDRAMKRYNLLLEEYEEKLKLEAEQKEQEIEGL